MMVCLSYFLLNDNKNPYLYPFLSTTLVMGIGFWTIYMMDWRKTGVEVGGGEIWWNSLRPVHGTIYLLFTLLSVMGYKEAWIFLLLDVVVGLAAYSFKNNI
jgi:hypothetical protein